MVRTAVTSVVKAAIEEGTVTFSSAHFQKKKIHGGEEGLKVVSHGAVLSELGANRQLFVRQVHICICVYVYMYTYACICIYIHIQCICLCVYVYAYVQVYVYVYVYAYVLRELCSN